jgi:UDP-glucose 4-epimerase
MFSVGWQPQLDNIQDNMSSAWEWHRSHPHGYDGV